MDLTFCGCERHLIGICGLNDSAQIFIFEDMCLGLGIPSAGWHLAQNLVALESVCSLR